MGNYSQRMLILSTVFINWSINFPHKAPFTFLALGHKMLRNFLVFIYVRNIFEQKPSNVYPRSSTINILF